MSRFSAGLALGLSATVVVFIAATIGPDETADAVGWVGIGLVLCIGLMLTLSRRYWLVGLGIVLGEVLAIPIGFLIALQDLARHTA